jgi:IclR family transcriptional regulator, acetate operon repressor
VKKKIELENSWIKEAREFSNSRNIQDLILNAGKQPSAVKSVFRASNILTCLSHGINSITDIAHYCSLNKATVHRILKALVESRLAMLDPLNHRYYLGYSIDQMISNPLTTHEYLKTCAFKPMAMLSRNSEETVFLCMSVGLQYIVLSQIESKHELRVFDDNNGGAFLHAGATSWVLLSQLNDNELKIALMMMDYKPTASGSTIDPGQLLNKIMQIRKLGYAFSYGERISGSLCIATPVRNYLLPAALGIIGPESRIRSRKKEFVQVLKTASAKTENNLNITLDILRNRREHSGVGPFCGNDPTP